MDWGVVSLNSVVLNWSGSLDDFVVIVNWGIVVTLNSVVNWSGFLGDFLMNNWGGFNMMMIMMVVMMIMMVMMVASVVTVLVVLVGEIEVVSSSDSIVVGSDSVSKDGEVRSVVGFVDEHILDKVIGEIRVSLGNEVKSFLDQVLVDVSVAVVISILRVEESG
jgi:uncharacterized membrane protein